MVRLSVGARVEKSGGFLRVRVEPGDVRAFESVAVWASESKILLNLLSAALFGDDVMVLGKQLGEPGSTRNDAARFQTLRISSRFTAPKRPRFFLRSLRAFDCNTPNRLPAWK